MAAVIRFQALDDKGEEILDQLERVTGEKGAREANGVRDFWVSSAAVGMAAFEEVLLKIKKAAGAIVGQSVGRS